MWATISAAGVVTIAPPGHLSEDDVTSLVADFTDRQPVRRFFDELQDPLPRFAIEPALVTRGLVAEGTPVDAEQRARLVQLAGALLSSCIGTSAWVSGDVSDSQAGFIEKYAHPIFLALRVEQG